MGELADGFGRGHFGDQQRAGRDERGKGCWHWVSVVMFVRYATFAVKRQS
jgi:hypothetical protein